MTRNAKAWAMFFTGRALGLAVDFAVILAAYCLAIALRFDFAGPRWGWRVTAYSFISIGGVYLLSLVLTGCYRIPWRRFRLCNLPRFFLAAVFASAVLTVMRYLLPVDTYTSVRPPYSVTLIHFLIAFTGLAGWRILWSWCVLTRVSEDDLLERTVRRMDAAVVREFLRDKTILVTGAGGTIGAEIVRQTVAAGARQLLLVERCENALYEIDRELRERRVDCKFVPLMVDAGNSERMEEIFAEYRPEVVLHAAAYKHVPMVEMNPREGDRNNTAVTAALAELALKYKVRRFVLISTDKAVNPVSVMGKSKLAAERAIMRMDGPFCAVRFGNVLGSSGSVVPLFRRQIAEGRPVTVTHPDMRRYFMSVNEAVGLVLQAASRKEKAIYTLDMGKPVRIVDLAEDMIRQAGYKPYVDIPIVFTGIRPGEKLFEELDISERSAYKTDMTKIYISKVMEEKSET